MLRVTVDMVSWHKWNKIQADEQIRCEIKLTELFIKQYSVDVLVLVADRWTDP